MAERFTGDPAEGYWTRPCATSVYILGAATPVQKGSTVESGNTWLGHHRFSQLSQPIARALDYNRAMTIRGDSKRIAKTLDQRKAVKLRALAMWSESGERLPYNPQWAVALSDNTHNATNTLPNFAGHSPLGSGEWIAPWNVRWSPPTK